LINIIGGIVIGIVQNDMSLTMALENYTVLTIGDGLLSQIPALVISSAAGMLVTRVPDEFDTKLHEQLSNQLLGTTRPLTMLTVALLGFMLMPGLRFPFLLVAALSGLATYRGVERDKEAKRRAVRAAEAEAMGVDPDAPSPSEIPVEQLLRVEPLSFELGVDLIHLVDERKGGNLVERIQRIRRQMAEDMGMLVPSVHIRDNLRLSGGQYRILLRGEEIAKGKVVPRQHLAIDPGDAKGELKGIKVKDPVFGLNASWIPESGRMRAQRNGFTVVDVPTVLTTHLTELLHQHGHELFGRHELGGVLDRLQEQNPRLVEELIPDPLTRGSVLRVFRNLLREGVSIRDAQTILEALADHAHRIQDPDALTEFVRQRMARHLTHRYSDDNGVIHYVGLARDAEEAISKALHGGERGAVTLTLEPADARQLLVKLRDASDAWRGDSDIVVLCPPLARGPLRRLTEKVVPRLTIVSPVELLPTARLERVAVISLGN
jgi:flagellar biosynthesis protein FlhA